MSIFCCCRGRRAIYRGSDLERQDIIELPVHPPRARLSKPPLSTYELELSPPQIVTPKAPSLVHDSIPEATVDPTILDVEDSDDDEPVRSTRNSSTGTLGVIKTKFIRPLSQKSDSKRYSQQSLGTSDEEIARRAELKRLMRKRIQEELKSEEEQEEQEVKTNNHEELKSDGSANIGLPGGGPRDNLEFSVPHVNESEPKDVVLVSPDDVLLALPVSNSQPAISLRPSSRPGSACRSHENSTSENHGSIKEQASLPQFPTSPQLSPVHLPSPRGSESIYSWRLSYSAEQVANYFGIPDDSQPTRDPHHTYSDIRSEGIDKEDVTQEDHVRGASLNGQEPAPNVEPTEHAQPHEPCIIHCQQHVLLDVEDSEDQHNESSPDTIPSQDSPLDIWLRSQDLQSASAVSSRRTSAMISQMLRGSPSPDSRSSQSDNPSAPPKLLETVRRSSDDLPESSCHARCRASHEDAVFGPTILPDSWSNAPQQSIMKATNNTLSDGAPKPVDNNLETSSSHYASSRCTTRPNSGQTTEKEPRSKLSELFGARKAMSSFSNFNCLLSSSRATDTEKSDISSYKTAPNEASALNITMYNQPEEADSAVFSDTASFKQREEELKSIEQRFGQVRRVTTPIASKFREEFDEPGTSTNTKNSIFAKLHFPMPKRAKQSTKEVHKCSTYVKCSTAESPATDVRGLGRQELTKCDVGKLPTSSSYTGQEPENAESTTSLQLHTIAVGGNATDALQLRHISSQSQSHSETNQVAQQQASCNSKLKVTDSDGTGSGSKAIHATAVCNHKPKAELGSNLKLPKGLEDSSSQRSDISNSVLREWVNLMNGKNPQPRAELMGEAQGRGPQRARTPPASWARWPSHTRDERTGPAGKEDRVTSRDFAVQGGSNAGATWSTGNPNEPQKKYISSTPRSLPSQLSKAVKEGLSRVHESLNRNTRVSSETLHDRQKPDGHLEYPELEILPMQGGYKELQALEKQIGTMKRGSISAENQATRLNNDNTRTHLSARLAEEVHMMQHRVTMDPCQDDEITVPTSPKASPMTTKVALLSPQFESETTARFATPKSHVSYEDCVPKHMLEDEESVDDKTTGKGGLNKQAS
ncbi:hypothetical protein F5Y05DRAFT_421529 [Hypoxylon sp. FL0543]|nr:hypothetical protein F5Y05DRAFT_421529 [Hypoxylon sp. FL0543]